MGLLDKAKSKIQAYSEGFGEETIRRVDWNDPRDEYNDEEETIENDFDQYDDDDDQNYVDYDDSNVHDYDEEEDSFDDEEYEEEEPEPVAKPEKPKKERKKVNFGEKINALKSSLPTPKVKEKEEETEFFVEDNHDAFEGIEFNTEEGKKKRASDILEGFSIPETFEIPNDVFLREDLDDLELDFQVPKGYDIAQVNSFVSRVKASVGFLQDKLKERNKHIVVLANIIDRQTIDLHNMRYDYEMVSKNNSVSVMAGESNDELQTKVNLLFAENAKLKKEKNAQIEKMIATQSDSEIQKKYSDLNKKYKILEDNYSLLLSQLEEIEKSNHELQNELNYQEEKREDEILSSDERRVVHDDDFDLPDVDDDDSSNYNVKQQKTINTDFFIDEDDEFDIEGGWDK